MAGQVIRLTDRQIQKRCASHILALDLSQGWEVEVRKPKRKRSLNQNALMHKWFGVIADEIGDDLESVKEDYITMYSPRIERENVNGETVMKPKRTSEMDKTEMSDFMAKIQAHAGGFLGIMLPDPRDLGRDEDGRLT